AASASPNGSLLAHRAEERRAPVLHHALHCPFAARGGAWFALAVIDAEMMLKISELAVRLAVVAQRRAAGLDRRVEHRLDGLDERVGALVRGAARRDGRGAALRRHVCAVQRLADIDVAEARDDGLVEECRLEARLAAGAALRQQRGVEGVAERLRA